MTFSMNSNSLFHKDKDNSKFNVKLTDAENIVFVYEKANFTNQNFVATDQITLAINQFTCSNSAFTAKEIHIPKHIDLSLTNCIFKGKVYKESKESIDDIVAQAEPTFEPFSTTSDIHYSNILKETEETLKNMKQYIHYPNSDVNPFAENDIQVLGDTIES